IRLEAADHPHDIREDLLSAPDLERLVRGLRVSEISSAREELAASVDAARGEQLLRAYDSQAVPELRTDEVLAAVAAREREVGRVDLRAQRPVGNQARVLVVRMRGDVESAAQILQLLERPEDLG